MNAIRWFYLWLAIGMGWLAGCGQAAASGPRGAGGAGRDEYGRCAGRFFHPAYLDAPA
jgi:hypothetical protein